MQFLRDVSAAFWMWAYPDTGPEVSASERGPWACWRSVRVGFEAERREAGLI